MNNWLRDFYIAQQTLDSAETPEALLDSLLDILQWMLGEGVKVHIYRDPLSGVLENLSLEAREAAQTLVPQSSKDGLRVALPLMANEESFGLVMLDSAQPIDPYRAALASTLAHIAAQGLSRLAWPASPQIFRQLVENANVAIDVADMEGTITYANLAAAQLYGFDSPADLVGRKVSTLFYGDEELRIRHDLITKSRTGEGWTGEVTQQYSNGLPLPVRMAVFAMRDHQNRMTSYGAIVQSLDEQQRLLLSLQQQTRRLRAAVQVARTAISKLDLGTLLNQVGSVTQALFNFDLVAILLVESGGLAPKVICSPEGRLDPPDALIPIDESTLNGWVTLTGQARLVNDASDEAPLGLRHNQVPVGAEVVVPMRLGSRVIGTLDVQSARSHAFQPEDVETLQSIADQLAVAVDNARLFDAQREKVKQLAALNTISQLLVAAYRLDDLWHTIYEQIAGLFNVSTFYVMSYDAPTNMLHYVWLVVNGKAVEPEPAFPLSGLSGLVIRSGSILRLHDVPAQREWLSAQGVQPLPIYGVLDARSWLGVPLRARDGTILGLISVQSHQPNVFSESDGQLLATIATQISLAMENARLFNQLTAAATQLKERARRLESLYKIGTLLSASLDRNRTLSLAAEQMMKLFKVDHCGIALSDEKTGALRMVSEYPFGSESAAHLPVLAEPVIAAYRISDVLVCNDVETDPRMFDILPALRALGVRSMVVVRLVTKGKFIGAISIDSAQRRDFTYEEIETCRTLATQVALAVENSDLYTKALAANELKSQFLATMSHELRTPLNAVMGYTEMVLSGVYGALSDKQKDRLQRVYANAQHLLLLINDVLDLAKIESGRMTLNLEPLEIEPLISGVVANIATQAEAKRLSLHYHCADGLPQIIGDSMRLRQIVINLLSNAVKFTREGSVTLRVFPISVSGGSSADYPLERTNVTLHDGVWVCISVEDTGIGIAPENFALIFDAFRQVDGSAVREYQGTGLGLSITRELVELHGGKLWVESTVGRGSVFTVALPVQLMPETKE